MKRKIALLVSICLLITMMPLSLADEVLELVDAPAQTNATAPEATASEATGSDAEPEDGDEILLLDTGDSDEQVGEIGSDDLLMPDGLEEADAGKTQDDAQADQDAMTDGEAEQDVLVDGEADDGEAPEKTDDGECEHEYDLSDYEWNEWVDGPYYVEIVDANGEKNEAYHERKGTRQYSVWCDKCRQYIDQGAKAYSSEEEHDYCEQSDGSYKCYDCGHILACDHPADSVVESGAQFDVTYSNPRMLDPEDTNYRWYHSVTKTYRVWQYCEKCERNIGDSDVLTDNNFLMPHTLKNGKCTECGYESGCTHEDTYTDNAYETRYVPDPDNARKHIATSYIVTKTICSACGEVLAYNEEEVENSSVKWNHDFNNRGVCYECGMHCQHVNTRTSRETRWSYEDIEGNDAYHICKGTRRSYVQCTDCYQNLGWLSSWEDAPTTIELERHYYRSGTNKCHDCGHVNACQHEQTYTEEYDTVICGYQQKDAAHHLTKYRRVESIYCSLCDKYLGETPVADQKTFTDEEAHVFTAEGKCRYCGYACEHAWGKPVVTWSGDETRIQKDALVHTVRGTKKTAVECTICGCKQVTTGDVIEEDEPHVFEDGFCLCGAEEPDDDPCEHDFQVVGPYTPGYSQREYFNDFSLDDEFCYRNVYEYSVEECSKCHTRRVVAETWEDDASKVRHNYDDDGRCTECNHWCEHRCAEPDDPSKLIYFHLDEDEEFVIDKNNTNAEGHIVISGMASKRWACPYCGKNVSRYGSVENVRVKHEFVNGKCGWCGYQAECTHPNAPVVHRAYEYEDSLFSDYRVEDWEYFPIEGNSIFHNYQEVYVLNEYCPDCGKLLRENVGTEKSSPRISHHSFNEDGTECEVCGYKNNCQHEGIIVDEEIWEDIPWDETQHVEVRETFKVRVCKYCQYEMERITEPEVTYVYDEYPEPHKFDEDGICKWCGYRRGETITLPDDPQADQKGFTIVNGVLTAYDGGYDDVAIPSGVLSIGANVFANDSDMESVSIPASVISIGAGAFANCRKLTKASIPASVTTIGDNAFSGCPAALTITAPCNSKAAEYADKNSINLTVFHNKVDMGVVEATCTEPGHKSGTKCEWCGTVFSGMEAIPAKGHNWGAAGYTWATDNSTVTAKRVCANDASHVETQKVNTASAVAQQPTCTAKGKTTYTATFTNAAFTKQTKTVENIPAKGHTEVTDKAVAATCTTAGKTDGKHCSVCNAVIKVQEVVKATGHKWGAVTYTWSTDNKTVTAKRVCQNDGKHVESETVNTAATIAQQPTCTAKGKHTYTATFKNGVFQKQTKTVEDIPAKGHTVVTDKGKPATYFETGLSDGKHCSVCKTVLVKQAVLAKEVYRFQIGAKKLKATQSVYAGIPVYVTYDNQTISKVKSSKTAYATVKNYGSYALVTTKKPGKSVTITVTPKSGKAAKLTLKMVAPPPLSIKITNKGPINLKKKKSVTLKTSMTPQYAASTLTWKSSNTTVATVNSKGKVTAKKKAGTAIITVTTKTNQKTASIVVNVK